MKHLFRSLSAGIILALVLGFKGLPAQNFETISAAMKSGDAAAIARNFEGNVEITIKNGSTSYSKSQGELVLKNFFATHHPKSFNVSHEGTSPEGSRYFIGSLATTAGNYRTYVYAKLGGGGMIIQEIRFEEQ
jgi:hypothetical protein